MSIMKLNIMKLSERYIAKIKGANVGRMAGQQVLLVDLGTQLVETGPHGRRRGGTGSLVRRQRHASRRLLRLQAGPHGRRRGGTGSLVRRQRHASRRLLGLQAGPHGRRRSGTGSLVRGKGQASRILRLL